MCTHCDFKILLGSVKIHDPRVEGFFYIKNLAVYLDEFLKSKSNLYHKCDGLSRTKTGVANSDWELPKPQENLETVVVQKGELVRHDSFLLLQ